MRKRSKNGFTIVELVVVIAVIGILTAILIPLFVNLTGKAQERDNQSFVRNINTQLAINEADKGFKNSAMEDSIKLAQNMGFDVTKITPYNNNDIVWDSVHDRFAIVKSDYDQEGKQNKDHVVYADASFDVTTPLYKLWKVYGSYEKDAQTYSIYAKETTSWDNKDIENLKVGFDAGKNTKINSIHYVGSGNSQDSENSPDVVIRTNSATTELIVNAPNDTVRHYDSVGTVHVIAVDPVHCYEENGKAVFTQIDSGKYKTTSTADVELLFVSNSSTVTVAVAPGTVDHAHAYDQTEADAINGTNPGVMFDYDENIIQNERTDVYHHVTDTTGLAEGEVTTPTLGLSKGTGSFETNKELDEVESLVNEAQAIELAKIQASCDHEYDENGVCTKCGHVRVQHVAKINNIKYLTLKEALDDATDGDTIELLCDVFCAEGLGDIQNITIDGKGYRVSFDTDIVPFDGSISYCTLKDLEFYIETPSVDFLLANIITESVFDNVDIYGKGVVTGNVGAFCWRHSGTSSFSNCDIYATLNGGGHATNYNSAFFGCPTGTINMTDCSFNGILKCGSAAMLVANSCYAPATFNLHNVKNNGLIQTTCGTNNGAFTIPNTIFAVTNDGTYTNTSINVDGEPVSLSEAVSMQYAELKGQGTFLVGPDDPTLNISLNEDKTFTITAASASNVSYYQIAIGTYVTVPGGSNRNYIFETISADSELVSTIKWADFVDYAWVALNPQAIEGELDGHTTYTLNDTMYYLVESSTYSTQSSVSELCICSVSAFKEDGTLIASVSYPF